MTPGQFEELVKVARGIKTQLLIVSSLLSSIFILLALKP